MKRHLNKRGKALLGAIVGLVIFAFPATAIAKDAIGSRIEVQKVEGTAYVVSTNGSKIDALEGVKLSNGQSLQTAAGSYAYLSLDDSKVVELDELSQVSVEKSGKKLKLEVEEGSLFFNVKEKLADDESMNIDASTMSMSIRGTSGVVELRRVNGEVTSSVDLLEGRVDMTYSDVTGAEREFTLWGGERLSHTDGDPAVYRDLIDVTELPGFAAKAITQDPDLAEKILTESGINSEYVDLHADEMLAASHQVNLDRYAGVFEEGYVNAVNQKPSGTDSGNNGDVFDDAQVIQTTARVGGDSAAAEPAGSTEKKVADGKQTAADTVKTTGGTPATPNGTAIVPQAKGSTGGSGNSGSSGGSGDSSSDSGSGDDGGSDSGDSDHHGSGDSGDSGSGGGSTATTYTFTYYIRESESSNDYTKWKTIEYKAGESVENPTAEKVGSLYFIGWKSSADESNPNNTNYYAQYSSVEGGYKAIFYDWDETVLAEKAFQDEAEAISYAASYKPEREGYSFTSWKELSVSESKREYMAQYTSGIIQWIVKFLDWNGTLLKSQTVDNGATATPPDDPTREGYTFQGWSPDPGTAVTSDTSIYATYKKQDDTARYYTVRFLNLDGTVLQTSDVKEGSTATAPENPTWGNYYVFSGWVMDGSYVDVNSTIITEDTDFTAGYTPREQCSVIFNCTNPDDSSETKQFVISAPGGDNIESEANEKAAQYDGYTFTGWDTNGHSLTSLDGSFSAYALYEKNTTYTVRFLDYDGTVLDIQTVQKGSTAILPDNPTRSSYAFTGWSPDPSNMVILEDTDFTAQYVARYKVIFNRYLNSTYSSGYDSVEVEYGGSVTLNDPAEIEGYTFSSRNIYYLDSAIESEEVDLSNIKGNIGVTDYYVN